MPSWMSLKRCVVMTFYPPCERSSWDLAPQILEEHKTQGEEDQALQNRVAKKAKKRAKAIGKGIYQ